MSEPWARDQSDVSDRMMYVLAILYKTILWPFYVLIPVMQISASTVSKPLGLSSEGFDV